MLIIIAFYEKCVSEKKKKEQFPLGERKSTQKRSLEEGVSETFREMLTGKIAYKTPNAI